MRHGTGSSVVGINNQCSYSAESYDDIQSLSGDYGLLGPCTVEAKMLMQKIWVDKCDWDDEVSIDIKTKFINFIQSLNQSTQFAYPVGR